MNVFIMRLSVSCSNSNLAARPVNTFQNCLSVSLFCCFLEKKLYLSSVRFLGFLNVNSQFSFISGNDAVGMTMYGCLSVQFFLPADPSDRNRILTTFLSAACSLMLFINAACLGLSSVGVLISSSTVIECFAFTAMTKMSHRFFHSILRGVSATSQYGGSPAKADGPLEVAPPLDSEVDRSAMLSLCECR